MIKVDFNMCILGFEKKVCFNDG